MSIIDCCKLSISAKQIFNHPDFLLDNSSDICTVTETWFFLMTDNSAFANECQLFSFKWYSEDHAKGRGGGVAILWRHFISP